MDNDSNFDDGFVEFKECGKSVFDPCCPPWTKNEAANTLQPVPGPGGLSSVYGVNYQASTVADGLMDTYLDYIDMAFPNFASLQMIYDVKAHGTGSTPTGSGSSVTGTGPNTVTYTSSGKTSGTFWNGFPFQQNTWYGFSTEVRAIGDDGSTLEMFENCSIDTVYYRVQSLKTARTASGSTLPLTLEISDGKKVIKRRSIQATGSIGRSAPVEIKEVPQELKDRLQRFRR